MSIRVTDLEEHGFAIIPAVLEQREVLHLTEVLTRAPLLRSRAGGRHALQDPAISAFAHDRRLLEIARQALGAEAYPFRATLFEKSPDANWLVVWHQDTALPLRERREVAGWGPWSVKGGIVYARAPAAVLSGILALRVHLDDSTAQNGPLRVLPGTHRLGLLDNDIIHRLAMEISPVDCLVPQGGLLAMRPLLVHASSKSQVKNPRRVLHIEYSASLTLPDGLQLAEA